MIRRLLQRFRRPKPQHPCVYCGAELTQWAGERITDGWAHADFDEALLCLWQYRGHDLRSFPRPADV